jgi:hypothetical protein
VYLIIGVMLLLVLMQYDGISKVDPVHDKGEGVFVDDRRLERHKKAEYVRYCH